MVSSDIRHAAASCSSFPAAREDARPSRPQDESRGAGRDPDGHEGHLDRHQHPLGYVPTLPLSPLHLTTDFGAGSEQKGAPRARRVLGTEACLLAAASPHVPEPLGLPKCCPWCSSCGFVEEKTQSRHCWRLWALQLGVTLQLGVKPYNWE